MTWRAFRWWWGDNWIFVLVGALVAVLLWFFGEAIRAGASERERLIYAGCHVESHRTESSMLPITDAKGYVTMIPQVTEYENWLCPDGSRETL